MAGLLRAIVLIHCTLLAHAASAQIPLRDLPGPAREIDDPFSSVAGATELRPGQLLVSDPLETVVTLVDFATGGRRTLGRTGAGPGEYTAPFGVLRLAGDTVVVFDAAGGGGAAVRVVKFLPNLRPGATHTMMLLNALDTTVIQGTMFADARGQVYSTSVKLVQGPSGITPADSMRIVRFALGPTPTFTTLAAIRTPQSGAQERQVQGTAIRVRVPFPGLANADAWALLPDGTIAIIRGRNYTVEFLGRDGRTTPPTAIPYERIPVTAADRTAELTAAREQLASVMSAVRKTLPPNYTLDLEIVAPPSWPTEYPPIAAIVAYPTPNGEIWVRRAVPARLGREQWDVIDRSGRLVARWRLPEKTTVAAVGDGSVYTVRTDADDLRYVQRVLLPARSGP